MDLFLLVFIFLSKGLLLLNAKEEVCCPDVDCYSVEAPWYSSSRPVPNPRCITDVEYLLITRYNPNTPFNVTAENMSLDGSHFNASKPTFFYFHGWVGSANNKVLYEIAPAYLVSVDANVFVVDFSSVSINVNYLQSVSDIRVTATVVAKFINYLISEKGVSKKQVHLMGLSLGGQLVGYIGKLVPGLRRITGIDPAGPMFNDFDCAIRLCKGDAEFVEAIQTNKHYVWGLGTYRDDYDVSFLVNGGYDQPGCAYFMDDREIQHFMSGTFTPIQDAPYSLICHHLKALYYYVEALANPNCTFWGVKADTFKRVVSQLTFGYGTSYVVDSNGCDFPTCLPMGIETINYPGASGAYIVPTNTKAPYCISAPSKSGR
ncbi:phospholipase A1-like [Periplaneta americana]|uniref:phospholipase A1-like n=1 Tax=Periplaneta americana TaxID=6978 RepID=UPI0037E7B1F3